MTNNKFIHRNVRLIDSGEKTILEEGTCAFNDHLFHRQVSHRKSTEQTLGIEMYLTPSTLYALRLSFQQGAVSTVFRKNMIERNITTSAFILATVGLSMSIFSVKKMLTSKHQGHL
ncbi:uncharacterized protein LOC143424069 [Xylocopa sonorina]|uniref:uncharacterized protein LOC143424069 n=1 Tax=Xylocopa sonorina TaxID=1818115 RepID=UPI00403AB031